MMGYDYTLKYYFQKSNCWTLYVSTLSVCDQEAAVYHITLCQLHNRPWLASELVILLTRWHCTVRFKVSTEKCPILGAAVSQEVERVGHPLIRRSAVRSLASAAHQSVLGQDNSCYICVWVYVWMADHRNSVLESALPLLMSRSAPCMAASAISVWMWVWMDQCVVDWRR